MMNSCDVCKKTFSHESALQVHVEMVHKENSHYYNVPNYVISRQDLLVMKDNFKCKHCKYSSVNKVNITSHIQVIHGVNMDDKSSEQEIGKNSSEHVKNVTDEGWGQSSRNSQASKNTNLLLPETAIDAIAREMEKENLPSSICTSRPYKHHHHIQSKPLQDSDTSEKNHGQTWWPSTESGAEESQDSESVDSPELEDSTKIENTDSANHQKEVQSAKTVSSEAAICSICNRVFSEDDYLTHFKVIKL